MPEVLYSNKCYAALKHFVPLLNQFEQLGCQMPCDLKYLAAFAEQACFSHFFVKHISFFFRNCQAFRFR